METKTEYIVVEGKRLTEDEYYSLPVSVRARNWLRATRPMADKLGYWRNCRLPVCRRAKACRGEVRPEDNVEERDTAYPPCAHGDEERRHEIIRTGMEEQRRREAAKGR
jgi:hypothetical protein